MDHGTATLIAWSYGLAGVGYAAYLTYLLSRGRESRRGRRAVALLLALAMSSVWGVCGLAFAVTELPAWLRAVQIADLLRFAGWHAFLLFMIRPREAPASAVVFRGLQVSAIALLAFGLSVQFGEALDGILPGTPQQTALFQSLAMVVMALVLLEQFFRNVAPDALWNVKPLCLGLGAALAFDLYFFANSLMFGRIDPDAFGVRGLVHALIIPLLALATWRRHDWTARIRLSQRAAFHSATLLLVGLYLLFMSAVGYYVRFFGGDWGRALQLALLFAASLGLLLFLFSGAMRAKLRVLLGKHFFRYRYDYREEWLRFTQTLSAQNSPQAMGEQIIRGLAEMLESPAGSLWVRDPIRGDYLQFARWNTPAVDSAEPGQSPLCRFLVDSGWVINLEEFRTFPGRYEKLTVPDWLSGSSKAWLVVPLMVADELIGFVVLDSARTRIDVNWEVNDLLRTAGRQAASFLAQMQATEALLEVRKFDAFNRMSAFVVHDLKNIVTQLSLMLKNAERHHGNPEFQQDMLMTVENSVERMRQLMLQLREGATPPGTAQGVDLAELIKRIEAGKAGQGRRVEVTIGERLATRGHADRIERVIGHLVQNALDATPVDGRVWIRLSRDGGQARVEVGDTGHGMSAEFMRERLFKPFQTTKQAGMGIGAYESFQYVQELGGKILVDSEVDVGTRFSMLLPLFEVSTQSDLRTKEATA